MSYSWFRDGSCTVGASDVVRFQSANITTAPNKPVVGDAFTVGGFRFYEIIFIGSDATGEYIRLNRAYEETAGSNISYAIARFASGTQNAKLVAMASAAINQKQISLDDMYEWYTSQADTVQFLGPDGTFTTLTTYYKLSQEVTVVGGNAGAITVVANNIANVNAVATNIASVNLVAPSIPAINTVNTNMPAIVTVNEDMVSVKNVSDNMADVKDAKNQADIAKSEADRAEAAATLSFSMSQAQFDAIREQNKERYAASGWVSFGNHESGKQVNECKPGLYTALTTPNTLLIGKAGGVGGSKTDYASVHIDGVNFNLTNQFVLTLPSHPTSAMPERMDMYGVESEKVEISAAAPNAYQGGLRGVGAAVNLFTATDQQKKDFFAQNSNTTYIGSDGKIYQWQLYKVSFAGTTDGVPSPTEQGYTLNSFGDLWLKSGKNLLYFGNVLRLNDGGYHPSFNPLGAAKFVGDTFWYNTATSITSREDCFNPAKLLTGSGSIASGKSGRPEIGGRYYDAIYADGFGGICRDMRYSAYGKTLEDFAEADQRVNNGTYRGFEFGRITKVISFVTSNSETDSDYGRVPMTRAEALRVFGLIGASTAEAITFHEANMAVSLYNPNNGKVIHSSFILTAQGNSTFGTFLDPANPYAIWLGFDQKVVENSLSGNQVLSNAGGTASANSNIFCSSGQTLYAIVTTLDKVSVGGSFLQTDVIGNPANILATPTLSKGWQGSWIPVIPDGTTKPYPYARKKVGENLGRGWAIWTTDGGASWTMGSYTNSTSEIINIFTNSPLASILVALVPYQAFAKQTENAVNAALAGLVTYNVFASSDYRPENGALLGESLIGKVLKNNSGVSVNNKSLLSCSIDGSGKLTSATNFDGVTHSPLTLGTPANNSPAFKVVSYLANINQQAVPHYAYTELQHNGTSWGDDGKVTIFDNQSTKPNDHGVTVVVGTAHLREPLGWFKNKA
ncbi:MAG: hypothetical protein ACRCUH_15115 [Shewanella sp.]